MGLITEEEMIRKALFAEEIFRWYSRVVTYGRMIKFSHTVFALPFALAALLLAHREHPITSRLVFLVIVAMVGARSAAMGFNRFADAKDDAENPRTAEREIPAGRISLRETAIFITGSSILFILAAAAISEICFWFSFPVLLALFGYSYTKRFTWLSHIVLGLVQGLVPIAVWVAVTGTFSAKILALSLTLCTYIAGFDILYACQDMEFDRRQRLYSMPARFGLARAMRFSSLLHLIAFLSLLSLWRIFALSPYYLTFVSVIGILLIVEHRLVKPDDLSRVNIAFYHVNSVISLLLFAALLTEEMVGRMF
ncbi:MAG: UbiA-like polyprenyltransferase [Syntrophales bacterium]|nr:UbiA-like polyprenyltransferase [Syntrophales bacterium]